MRYAIITCQIADPDFGIIDFLRLRSFSPNNDLIMHAIADQAHASRWPDQIVRVHKYNCNLPSIIPANLNNSWAKRVEACRERLSTLSASNEVFEAINLIL